LNYFRKRIENTAFPEFATSFAVNAPVRMKMRTPHNVPFFSLTTTCCALKPLMGRGGPEKREILKNVEKTQKSA